MALGFIVALNLALRQAKHEKISAETIGGLCFTALISGIVGARILYVLSDLELFIRHPLEIFMLQHGGLSWFGGLILGTSCGIIYLRIKKFPVMVALDLVVPFLALAQAIGRIGCLFNGCCLGKPSQFGIYFDGLDAVLIPTQIYSSMLLVGIFVFLRFIQDIPGKKTGTVFFAYLILYSVKRFFIEYFRADNPLVIGGLTLFQLMSILAFVAGLAGLLIIRKKNN